MYSNISLGVLFAAGRRDLRKGTDYSQVDVVGGKPQLEFVAKLASSAETLLRYQVAWKKDFYRALEKLESLQQSRRPKRGVAGLAI